MTTKNQHEHKVQQYNQKKCHQFNKRNFKWVKYTILQNNLQIYYYTSENRCTIEDDIL